ncbi:MAG TPA: ATP-binding protein [Bacteroidales bacterium]|nr:ATP-binding protein [Bacteroidales bacterium]HPI85104.1 ATP-binding protein [Bacteroidales bacterium]HPM91719.1 ATP-binding protein [Bacteroidales bacterium]
MKENPFKFGSIVDEPYFTDRILEIEQVKSIIGSQNHLTIISPRRFGKSSLIMKVANQTNRPLIAIDMQLITSTSDLAAQILKRIYRIYPFEKVRQLVKNFRVIPSITLNPLTNQVEVSFLPDSSQVPLLEDVLNLMEKLSSQKKKLLMIFDEFQETRRIHPDLLRQLRSIMQYHKLINYIFLGSQESLIKEIFEMKKSPFYHFGMIIQLGKIPETDFFNFLASRLEPVNKNASDLAQHIISYTGCHPYYTQQLAFVVWDKCYRKSFSENPVSEAAGDLISMHDMDYERWWMNLNKTDKKLLIGLSLSNKTPLSEAFYRKNDLGAPSTVFSSIKRLMVNGYIIKVDTKYEIDDPFFGQWLRLRREA